MKKQERIVWGVAILLVDLLIFIMPLTAIFFAYVVLARPAGFKKWIDDLYAGE